MKEKQPTKRYNLVLPETEFDKIQTIADEKDVSLLHVIRQFINLGLEIDQALENGGKVIKKEGDKEIELLIL